MAENGAGDLRATSRLLVLLYWCCCCTTDWCTSPLRLFQWCIKLSLEATLLWYCHFYSNIFEKENRASEVLRASVGIKTKYRPTLKTTSLRVPASGFRRQRYKFTTNHSYFQIKLVPSFHKPSNVIRPLFRSLK